MIQLHFKPIKYTHDRRPLENIYSDDVSKAGFGRWWLMYQHQNSMLARVSLYDRGNVLKHEIVYTRRDCRKKAKSNQNKAQLTA